MNNNKKLGETSNLHPPDQQTAKSGQILALPDEHPCLVLWSTNPTFQSITSAICLCAILLSIITAYTIHPYDGMFARPVPGDKFLIQSAYPGEPAEKAGIRRLDQLLSIDGQAVDTLMIGSIYRHHLRPGDVIEYEVQRGSKKLTFKVTLGDILNDQPLLIRIIISQLVGVAFGLHGLLLCHFSSSHDIRARLLGLTALFAGVLITNSSVGWRSMVIYTIAQIVLCLGGAFYVTAHLYFPTPSFIAQRKYIINAFIGTAFLLCVILTLPPMLIIVTQGKYSAPFRLFLLLLEESTFYLVGIFAFLVLLTTLSLWTINYFRTQDANIKRQLSIIIWATVLSACPYMLFEILEFFTRRIGHTPFSYVSLALTLLPCAYVYVTYQNRLTRIDSFINQSLTYLITGLSAFLVSLIIFSSIVIFFDTSYKLALIGAIGIALFSPLTPSLNKTIQKRVNRVLYGYHHDFISITASFSDRFAQTVERKDLVHILTQELSKQIDVRQSKLFLAEEGNLVLQSSDIQIQNIPPNDELQQALQKTDKPTYAEHLWAKLPQTVQERWACLHWAQLFVPIVFEDRLQGLLVLGGRHLSDVYSEQDIQIITTIAHQAALAYENVLLVANLRQALAAVEATQRRLLTAREEERRELAWELHDGPVQDLIALSNHIRKHQELASDSNNNPNSLLELTHREALRIMGAMRETCSTLRSDALDVIGLGPAMIEYARNLMKKSNVGIYLDVPNHGPWLKDPLGIMLLRVFQEAVTNAIEHAKTQEIWVYLRSDQESYELRIWDKGCGFTLPKNPDAFIIKGHFGLATMRERVAAVGGKIKIHSSPDNGTDIRIQGKIKETVNP